MVSRAVISVVTLHMDNYELKTNYAQLRTLKQETATGVLRRHGCTLLDS